MTTLPVTKNLRVGALALLMALAMLALGFAAVPLYQMFCQVTGFGGTTQRATLSDAVLAERMAQSAGAPMISVRFDGTTAGDIPWTFKPDQVTQNLQLGERKMAFFTATNDSSVPITGTATFNVEPEQTGRYFNKIQCFCFTEQTLAPGQTVHMPVLYYVDPAIMQDDNARNVEQITLSYTFHKAKQPES